MVVRTNLTQCRFRRLSSFLRTSGYIARHARACPGHPRPRFTWASKTWMAGTSPAMTKERASNLLRHEPVSQRPDPRNVDLDDVAGLQVGRGAVGAHPDHVARPQREIFGQFDEERHDAEDHVVGMKTAGLLAVDLDAGLHFVEIDVGLDPRSHRLEGVGVLGPPQPAIGLLPAALADIIADGITKHAGHRIDLAKVLCLLAHLAHPLALVMYLLGGGRQNHDILVVRDQRVL